MLPRSNKTTNMLLMSDMPRLLQTRGGRVSWLFGLCDVTVNTDFGWCHDPWLLFDGIQLFLAHHQTVLVLLFGEQPRHRTSGRSTCVLFTRRIHWYVPESLETRQRSPKWYVVDLRSRICRLTSCFRLFIVLSPKVIAGISCVSDLVLPSLMQIRCSFKINH